MEHQEELDQSYQEQTLLIFQLYLLNAFFQTRFSIFGQSSVALLCLCKPPFLLAHKLKISSFIKLHNAQCTCTVLKINSICQPWYPNNHVWQQRIAVTVFQQVIDKMKYEYYNSITGKNKIYCINILLQFPAPAQSTAYISEEPCTVASLSLHQASKLTVGYWLSKRNAPPSKTKSM